jgi:hypothetical protein
VHLHDGCPIGLIRVVLNTVLGVKVELQNVLHVLRRLAESVAAPSQVVLVQLPRVKADGLVQSLGLSEEDVLDGL